MPYTYYTNLPTTLSLEQINKVLQIINSIAKEEKMRKKRVIEWKGKSISYKFDTPYDRFVVQWASSTSNTSATH